MAVDSIESLEGVAGFDPADTTYKPQSEYRAYRNVISFIETLPTNAGAPLAAVSRWPIVTQQLNTATTTEVAIGYDPFRQYVNQAFVTSASDTWDPTWKVIHGQPLYSGTPIVTVDINAHHSGNFYIGKGCFLPNLKPEGLPYNNTGSVVVIRYAYPKTEKSTGATTISQLTVTRSGGPYASNMASDFTWTSTWEDITTTGLTFNFPGTPRRRIEAISCTSNGTFIALVTRNNPEIAGTGQFLPHTEMMFYKVTGCQWWDSTGAASGNPATAVWTPLSPVWSFPITDTDYNNTGPVYNMEWMSYCFSAPYDGPGIIYNNGGAAKPGLGWTVTVFNGDKYGKALYFVEKDGFCSDINPLIPTYNAGQTDYVTGMGSTGFTPTGLVQMSMRRNTELSGLYLSGEFVRTADDGIATNISCYMQGNSLVSNVNGLATGAFTGNFGWSFGARNFFIDDSGGKACLPLPSNSKFSLEFDYEPTGLGSGWPTIVDTNLLSNANNAYESQRATLFAFSVTGKIFKADLTNSRFHNPPFLPAHEIVEWTANRQSGSATAFRATVQRAALHDRPGRPSLLAQHTVYASIIPANTTVTLNTGAFGNSERMFPVGSYFQIDTAASATTSTYLDPNVEVFKVLSRSWSAGAPDTLTITVERGAQGTPIQSYSGSAGVFIVPYYSRFESGNMLDIRYWADGTTGDGHPAVKIGGFMIDDIEYETQSGVGGLVTVHGMDLASALMSTWSSPIDMFFDPKSILPLGDSKRVDGVPSLKHLIQKTPAYPVDLDGLNGYESWDKDAGYKHWGVNRPAIFYNAQTEVGGNPLNKHRIRFGASVNTDLGVQSFGSIIAGYDDGAMVGAFIGPPTKRAIWASNSDTRTSGGSGMDTGAASLRVQDNATAKNRVNILGSRMQVEGDYQGFTLAPGGRHLVAVNGFQGVEFLNVTLHTTNSAMADTVGTTFTINGNYASSYTANDLIQLQDAGCTTSNTVLNTGYEIMKVVSASYSAPNTTVTVTRAARGTTATTHLTGLVVKRIVGVDYKTKQLDTIFGASNDYWDGYQRIAGGGGYKIDTNLTIAQGTDYDYAVKQFGRNILVYYKASAYGAGALNSSSNIYTLATHYLAESNRDAWLRPAKKKYGGFAVSTDSWFRENTTWPDAEVGLQSLKYNAAINQYNSVNGGYYYDLYNWSGDTTHFEYNGSNTITDWKAYVNHFDPRVSGYPVPVLGWGAIFSMGSLLYTARFWDTVPGRSKSVTTGVDGSNPCRGYGDAEILKWTFLNTNNVVFHTTGYTPDTDPPGGNYALQLGIPYRSVDVPGGAVGNRQGYLLINDEVVRWKESIVDRTTYSWRGEAGGTWTGGEYMIIIPSDITTPSGEYDITVPSIKMRDWRSVATAFKGWYGSGTNGMGKWAYLDVFSAYTRAGGRQGLHGLSYTNASSKDTIVIGEDISDIAQASGSYEEIAVIWPRAQLGTDKGAHSLGDYVCAYPVANAESGGYPADYDATTLAQTKDYAIKESVWVKRNTSFQGPYRSVADSIFQTTALSGVKSVFQEQYATITGSFVDVLPTSNATYTTSSWSLVIAPNTYNNSNAEFQGVMLRFRNSNYYLSITAADWTQTTGTKALTMTLYWGDSANDDILEKVEVPLFGHSNTVRLTAPLRVSLSSDTLSVDLLDEQIWSFDLASYSDGNGSTYYSAEAGPLEIKTAATFTNTECWWFLSELGDEVEATVVDRGSDFSSALSFLLNGRWVKSNPTTNGFLLSSRFLGRYSPYDLSSGIMRTQYTLSTANAESPGLQAGHVESSGGTFGEVVNASWIRDNGYMFKEQQNRLILTPSDARLESKLKLRDERENSQKFSLIGHLLPSLQVDNGIPWTSASPDYVVEAHTLSAKIAQATSSITCRRYYAL